MNNRVFSKILILIIFFTVITGGILVWENWDVVKFKLRPGIPMQEAPPYAPKSCSTNEDCGKDICQQGIDKCVEIKHSCEDGTCVYPVTSMEFPGYICQEDGTCKDTCGNGICDSEYEKLHCSQDCHEQKKQPKKEQLSWKDFWEDTRKKGCYLAEVEIVPEKEKQSFLNREEISWQGCGCSVIEECAQENPALHQVLLESEGAIENDYEAVWACRGEEWLSTTSQIGYFDFTGNGNEDVIVLYRGGAAMRSHSVGIFQFQEGDYLKIIDKNIRYSNFEVGNEQLVEIAPMYLFEEAECCPSNHAHIYYKFVEGKLETEKVVDDYGYDISDIFPTLSPCD